MKPYVMKRALLSICILIVLKTNGQPNVLPALPETGPIALTHATIHVGNGDVIEDGTIVFSNGKITWCGEIYFNR
jgi:imidazolonepropionase-like amidohydrolase